MKLLASFLVAFVLVLSGTAFAQVALPQVVPYDAQAGQPSVSATQQPPSTIGVQAVRPAHDESQHVRDLERKIREERAQYKKDITIKEAALADAYAQRDEANNKYNQLLRTVQQPTAQAATPANNAPPKAAAISEWKTWVPHKRFGTIGNIVLATLIIVCAVIMFFLTAWRFIIGAAILLLLLLGLILPWPVYAFIALAAGIYFVWQKRGPRKTAPMIVFVLLSSSMVQAQTITKVTPDGVRQGESFDITVMTDKPVEAADVLFARGSGLTVSDLKRSGLTTSFKLAVAPNTQSAYYEFALKLTDGREIRSGSVTLAVFTTEAALAAHYATTRSNPDPRIPSLEQRVSTLNRSMESAASLAGAADNFILTIFTNTFGEAEGKARYAAYHKSPTAAAVNELMAAQGATVVRRSTEESRKEIEKLRTEQLGLAAEVGKVKTELAASAMTNADRRALLKAVESAEQFQREKIGGFLGLFKKPRNLAAAEELARLAESLRQQLRGSNNPR